MKTSVTPVQISNLLKWLGWILLFILLWFKGCGSDCGKTTTNVKVTVPEVKGSFKPKQPNHVSIVPGQKPIGQILSNSDKSKNDKSNAANNNEGSINNDSLISELLAETELMSRKYYELKTQREKDSAYIKSIQLNLFSDTFEDKNIRIDFNGIVRGEVKSIQPFYTIKERKIDFPVPVTKFRLLAGGGGGLNSDLNQVVYKFNLGFQNQKGNIIRGSYMKIGNQTYGIAEYDFSIFKISK